MGVKGEKRGLRFQSRRERFSEDLRLWIGGWPVGPFVDGAPTKMVCYFGDVDDEKV
jgi:hypothetical protein